VAQSAAIIEIALAVVRHAGRVLIGQRPPGAPLAGLWEFPGGKVQPGERAHEAAARECREETGLEVRVAECLAVVEHEYGHGRVRLQFFCAGPVDLTQQPRAPFRWVGAADLKHYSFPPANDAVVEALLREGPGHEGFAAT